jgi:hypothetical protein
MSQSEAQISPTISPRRGTKQPCTNEDCGRRFYAAIAAPCSAKSCSRSPQRPNRYRGRSQPEKRRTSFRAVEPTILPCISSWSGS